MKLSHRHARLFLRILHCLGMFFGCITLIYELVTTRRIFQIIAYLCYLPAAAAVLYLLFSRKRLPRKFAFATAIAMSSITGLFFLMYIYESVTVVSELTDDLIQHIEYDHRVNPSLLALIILNKCCSISPEHNTRKTFLSFQTKYPHICGMITYEEAKPCLPFIHSQRSLVIVLSGVMIIIRVLVLILLWKYVKNEYNEGNRELTIASVADAE